MANKVNIFILLA